MKRILLFLLIFSGLDTFSYEKVWENVLIADDYGFETMMGNVSTVGPNGEFMISASVSSQLTTFVELNEEGKILRYSTVPVLNGTTYRQINNPNVSLIYHEGDSYKYHTTKYDISNAAGFRYTYFARMHDESMGINEVVHPVKDDNKFLRVSALEKYDEDNTIYMFSNSRMNIFTKVLNNGKFTNEYTDVLNEQYSGVVGNNLKKFNEEFYLLSGNSSSFMPSEAALVLTKYNIDFDQLNSKYLSTADIGYNDYIVNVNNQVVNEYGIYVICYVTDNSGDHFSLILEFDNDLNLVNKYELPKGTYLNDIKVDKDKIVSVGMSGNPSTSQYFLMVLDKSTGETDYHIWGDEKEKNTLMTCQLNGKKIYTAGRKDKSMIAFGFDETTSISERESINSEIKIIPNIVTNTANVFYDGDLPQYIEIFNTQGQRLILSDNINHINTADLPEGKYYISFAFENSQITKQIIVTK